MSNMEFGVLGVLVLAVFYLFTCLRVLKEYERGVIFRLGRVVPKPRGPGLILVFGPFETMTRVGLRIVTTVIEPQVINAEGEFQAAEKLRQAAEIMTPFPMAMQMRYLQALADVASDQNSTIIFPLPLELLKPFMQAGREVAGAAAQTNGRPEVNATVEAKR